MWSAYSSVLDCDILLSQELHREETDGSYRILDPETGEPLASSSEKDELLAEKDVHLEQQRQRLEDQGTKVAAFITGSLWGFGCGTTAGADTTEFRSNARAADGAGLAGSPVHWGIPRCGRPIFQSVPHASVGNITPPFGIGCDTQTCVGLARVVNAALRWARIFPAID